MNFEDLAEDVGVVNLNLVSLFKVWEIRHFVKRHVRHLPWHYRSFQTWGDYAVPVIILESPLGILKYFLVVDRNLRLRLLIYVFISLYIAKNFKLYVLLCFFLDFITSFLLFLLKIFKWIFVFYFSISWRRRNSLILGEMRKTHNVIILLVQLSTDDDSVIAILFLIVFLLESSCPFIFMSVQVSFSARHLYHCLVISVFTAALISDLILSLARWYLLQRLPKVLTLCIHWILGEVLKKQSLVLCDRNGVVDQLDLVVDMPGDINNLEWSVYDQKDAIDLQPKPIETLLPEDHLILVWHQKEEVNHEKDQAK